VALMKTAICGSITMWCKALLTPHNVWLF
jgi:hypothetical protein